MPIESSCPKQPYFIKATNHYYKFIMLNYGISHFYAFTADSISYNEVIGIPDGCVDIMYSCNEKTPSVGIYGTGLSPRLLELDENNYYFGVRFIPGFLPDFNTIKLSEVIGNDITFTELSNNNHNFEKIICSRNFNEQINLFLAFYLPKYSSSFQKLNSTTLNYFIRNEIIKNSGNTRINELAEKSGYTCRHVTKTFQTHFGMNPKTFSEIVKFQSVLQTLNNNNKLTKNPDIEDFYSDQSHMIRFFRKYMSTTPKVYLNYLHSMEYEKKLIIL